MILIYCFSYYITSPTLFNTSPISVFLAPVTQPKPVLENMLFTPPEPLLRELAVI